MAASIRIFPLGAGQDVGRSCLLLTIGGKTIMLDCGSHMGLRDAERFPDFRLAAPAGDYNAAISAVVVTHFHLDHCGALPLFTEYCKYTGPVIMTHPTRALCPVMLEDYRKVMVGRRGETVFYSSEDIAACMKKVTAVQLHQTIVIDGDIEITPFYAGHVLGAAMFRIVVGAQSVVYTGDFNTSPDHHLGPAWIDSCRPDVLITETTSAAVTRDSKLAKEAALLHRIHDCVKAGGKVLIPVFAVGRVQEFCVMLDSFWDRVGLEVPIRFTGALLAKATQYYKLYLDWTNERTQTMMASTVPSVSARNPFNYKHVGSIDDPFSVAGPLVLFATPGMLNGGMSLEVFKRWCTDPKNLIIFPGYCLSGTVGHKVLSYVNADGTDKEPGKEKVVHCGGAEPPVTVRCGVENLSFSGHADGKGVMHMVRRVNPRSVVLVHGEAGKMELFKRRVVSELKLPCYNPANHTLVEIETPAPPSRALVSDAALAAPAGSTTTLQPAEGLALVLSEAEARAVLGCEADGDVDTSTGFSLDASSCCMHECTE